MIPGQVARLEIDRSAEEIRDALPGVVEGWGGTLSPAPDGSRVEIPVLAGLRRGRVGGTLRIEPSSSGSVVSFTVEAADLEINFAACGVLLLSVAGALTSMAWPWFPRLLPAVPLGLVLAVGGWLLIAARLRSSGPEEFLAAVGQAVHAPKVGSDDSAEDHGDDVR